MAKKSAGRLAGLAALAGAAYLASKGKESKGDDGESPKTKFRQSEMKADKEDSAAEAMMSSMGEDERPAPTGMGAATELVAPRRVATPKAPVARASGSGGGRGPAAGEEAAYRASRRAVSSGGSGGGRGPAIGEEEAYRNPASRIPSSGPEGGVPGGERVSSTELGRNVNAALMGRGTGMATAGKIAGEAATAKGALARAAEAKRVRDFISGGAQGYNKGGAVKKMASGGMTSSASKRADGIATKGKTRGKMC